MFDQFKYDLQVRKVERLKKENERLKAEIEEYKSKEEGLNKLVEVNLELKSKWENLLKEMTSQRDDFADEINRYKLELAIFKKELAKSKNELK